MNDSSARFLHGLSTLDEERAPGLRELVKDSKVSKWARETTLGIYQAIGNGEWPVDSIYDIQMFLTAIEENPALFPYVKEDLERVVERLERIGGSFRRTWEFMQQKLAAGEGGAKCEAA